MSKLHYTSVKCSNAACQQRYTTHYSSLKDYRAYAQAWRQSHKDWFCDLHNGGHLDLDNLKKSGEIVFVVVPPDKKYTAIAGKHFFDKPPSVNRALKWNADPNDFPIGTQIVERTIVEVILPEQQVN